MNNTTEMQIRTLVRTYLTWTPDTTVSWGGGKRPLGDTAELTNLDAILSAVDCMYQGQHGSDPLTRSQLEAVTRRVVENMVQHLELAVVPYGGGQNAYQVAVRTTGQRLRNRYCEQSSQPKVRDHFLNEERR